MTAFSAAVDALFANGDLAADVIWTPEATGVPVTVRAIRKAPDDTMSFGSSSVHVTTTIFDVRQSEMASPRPGDRLTFAGSDYKIQGEPVSDRERLVWTLDTHPAA